MRVHYGTPTSEQCNKAPKVLNSELNKSVQSECVSLNFLWSNLFDLAGTFAIWLSRWFYVLPERILFLIPATLFQQKNPKFYRYVYTDYGILVCIF